jgi:predicted protein tyrosine phosphatase
MEIVIRNYLSASQLLLQEPNSWDVIAILDSKLKATDFISKNAKKYLILHFDDVTATSTGKIVPNISSIRSAIEFGTKSDKLLVCCRAGQSRSAAIAFLIAHSRLGSAEAYQLINPKRHDPNKLVVELGSQLADSHNPLSTLQEWRKNHYDVHFTNYLDEITLEFEILEAQGARNLIID